MTEEPKKLTNRRFPSFIVGIIIVAIVLVIVVILKEKFTKPEITPIIIGHQADLTGGISSWGYWLDKAAKAAVDKVNREGGIAGRPVKYVVEDTETKPEVAARKMRRLILQHKADFIIGTVHSGCMNASLGIAKQLKTLYFPTAMASEGTAERGNRYVFRLDTNVREQTQASAKWVVENLAKKWTTCVSDYAWGWSHEKWFKHDVEATGGEVIAQLRIPQGTKDFFPYVNKIPQDTEAIYFIFFGADTLGFIQQLYNLGYRGKKFTVVCTLEAIDIASLGAAAEDTWLLEYLPRDIDQAGELDKLIDNEYARGFRETIQIDSGGKEIGDTDRVAACSHCWATYSTVFLLKEAIERSGWSSKKDNPILVKTLEGMSMKQSFHFPQGDNVIRAADHQGFHQHWMSHVENGKLVVKFKIDAADVTYPEPVDFTKEKL